MTTAVQSKKRPSIRKLQQFIAPVEQRLAAVDFGKDAVPAYEIKFVEWMPEVDGVRYKIKVSFDRPLWAAQHKAIADALDVFCEWNGAPVLIDGYWFLLGDGDDSSAVEFDQRYATYSVWLRGWRVNPFTGERDTDDEDEATLREIARGNIERHLGDCDSADDMYDTVYTLAFDALHDRGVSNARAQEIARSLAMDYAAP